MKKLIYNETTNTTFAPYDEENFNRVIGSLIEGTTKKKPKKLVSADDNGYTFEGKIEDEELEEYLEYSNNYKVKIFIFTEDYKHSRCKYEDREIRAFDYFEWKIHDEIFRNNNPLCVCPYYHEFKNKELKQYEFYATVVYSGV